MKSDNTEQLQEFSRRLKLSMSRAHVNATDLAGITGIGKSDISNYMNGKYMPKQDRIYLLASALNVSPAWLYGFRTKLNVLEGLEPIAVPFTEQMFTKQDDSNVSVSDVNIQPQSIPSGEVLYLNDKNIYTMVKCMSKLSEAERLKLLDMTRIMFPEAFSDN